MLVRTLAHLSAWGDNFVPRFHVSAFSPGICNANPASTHRDNGVLLQVAGMARQQVSHKRDAPFGGHVGQTDQPAVREIFRKNELTEIGINGNEDALFIRRELKQRTVARVIAPLARFDHVMALFP